MVSMVAGSMVAGSIRIIVPAGIIAMGGRAMAGTGVEQTCHGVALALRQACHGVALQQTCHGVALLMAQKNSSHEEALIQHMEFGEPTTGCRLPLQWPSNDDDVATMVLCIGPSGLFNSTRNLESLLQDAGSLFREH